MLGSARREGQRLLKVSHGSPRCPWIEERSPTLRSAFRVHCELWVCG